MQKRLCCRYSKQYARARKSLESGHFNLVLSDLRLPDGDGIHLLKWMNEHSLELPLIIMTGYADIQTAVEAIKSGAKDYISKPVNPDELLKKINEALSDNDSIPPKQSVNKGEQINNKFRIIFLKVKAMQPNNYSVMYVW